MIVKIAVECQTPAVVLNLNFDYKKWSLQEDLRNDWPALSASTKGPFVLKGSNLEIQDDPSGNSPRTVVMLEDGPNGLTNTTTAGWGTIVNAKEPYRRNGKVSWVVEGTDLSLVRSLMLRTIENRVPKTGIPSNNASLFAQVCPLSEATLRAAGQTGCNSFTGFMIGLLEIKLRSKQHWSKPALDLLQMEQEVKDCYVPRSSGSRPRPGDIFGLDGGQGQPFRHVGVVYSVNGDDWTHVDGGQKGMNGSFVSVQWCGPESIAQDLKGWIDLDKYFSAASGAAAA